MDTTGCTTGCHRGLLCVTTGLPAGSVRGLVGGITGEPWGYDRMGSMSNPFVPNSIVMANGKGGVGKTALAAATAGLLALEGWSVLLVDLDRQGNLQRDLGYRTWAGNDAGAGLAAALMSGAPLAPTLRGVRENLDVVCGGRALDGVAEAMPAGNLAAVLAPLAAGYNVVVLDCPTAGPMLAAALSTVGGVVVPIRPDDASVEGLEVVAAQYSAAKATNPALTLLGVALFAVPARATLVRARVRAELEHALAGACPVFDAVVRFSIQAAVDMRRWGELPHEHRDAAKAPRKHGRRFSTSAVGLADDYEALVGEITAAFLAATTGTEEL